MFKGTCLRDSAAIIKHCHQKYLGIETVCFISHVLMTVHHWGEVRAGTQPGQKFGGKS